MTVLWIPLLSTVLIASGVVYFGRRRSGYSHVRHTISELGEIGSPFSQIVSLGVFLPVGAGCLVVARWSAGRLGGGELSDGLSTLALSIGAGYVVAAIFRCDPGCPLTGSWRQDIHNVGGGIEYVGGAAGLWRIGHALDHGAANSLTIAFRVAAAIVAVTVLLMSIPALFRWRGAIQRGAEALLFAALVAGAGLLETRVPGSTRTGPGLQRENQPQAAFELFQQRPSNAADLLREELAIDGDHLGDVGDRVLGEPRRPGRHQDVPRRLDQADVRRQRDGDHGLQPAAVERIGLDNKDGAAKSRLRSGRLPELGPPDIAALDYH